MKKIKFILILFPVILFAQMGRLGQDIKYIGKGIPNTFTDQLIDGEPKVSIGFDSKNRKIATITFKTYDSLNPAKIFYGIIIPKDIFELPRYRRSVSEESDVPGKEHSLTLRLDKIMQDSYDVDGEFLKNQGGTIVYKIELWNNEQKSSTYYEYKFAFKKNERIPCVIEGPFVDIVEKDNAVISWETDIETKGTVTVDGKSYSQKESSTHHEIFVNGLHGKSHSYFLLNEDESGEYKSRIYAFNTQSDDKKVIFSYMSDSRSGYGGGSFDFNGVNYTVLEKMFINSYQKKSDFILFGGDLINGYSARTDDFQRQLRTWKSASGLIGKYIPVYEGIGNHEITVENYLEEGRFWGYSHSKSGKESSEEQFALAFVNPENTYPEREWTSAPSYKETAYFFDWNNVRVIAVNTNYWVTDHAEIMGGNKMAYIMDNQLSWLDSLVKDADNNKNIDHIFYFAHSPAFPTGGHPESAMWYSGGSPEHNKNYYGDKIDRTYIVERRDKVWETIAQSNKSRAFMFGDEHNYSRLLITDSTPVHLDNSSNDNFNNPVYQIISGGVGAPYYNQDQNVPWARNVNAFSALRHFVLIETEGKNAYLYVISYTNEIIEKRQISKRGKTVDFPTKRLVPIRNR